MISAVLLAAGMGQRMQGQAKALLRYRGRSFVEHALEQLQGSVDEIVVVTGAYREGVESILEGLPQHPACPHRIAHNPLFATGLMSSLQCGLKAVNPAARGVLITLVDLPLLLARDYRAAVEAWTPGKLLRAVNEDQPAHPVIIPCDLWPLIFEQPHSDRGCSFLFKAFPERVQPMQMAAGSVDIDTLEDLHAHITS